MNKTVCNQINTIQNMLEIDLAEIKDDDNKQRAIMNITMMLQSLKDNDYDYFQECKKEFYTI